jgi:2-polyprenyl-3-methyl-5-hydroxy-6-metoxy-1,4-benzoquinol methylase
MDVDPIKLAKNGAYQFEEELQRALDAGEITEAEWFRKHEEFIAGLYVAADNPRAQSGHGGDEAQYRYTRMMVLEAIHRSGTFLDVGCANGCLMESLHRWLQGTGLNVEFYGLDISERLVELARKRLPHWRDRFFVGNALDWSPPKRFDFVCIAELEYVPRDRRKDLMRHLYDEYVADGGRLILGPSTQDRDSRQLEDELRCWGYPPSGYCEKSHQKYETLARRLFWFDKS